MNLKKIIDKNKFLKFFKNHLFSEKSPFEENQKKIFFDFKIDSYLPFVLTKLRNNNLIIFSNFKEAAYFVNDIKSLNFSDCILFPHIDSKDDDEAKSQIKKERSNVLNFLVEKESTIVVSYSDAVIQKVVNKKTYLNQTLRLRKNEIIEYDSLIEKLEKIGFEMIDFISQPGQFSVRGSIIDIFSHNNKNPVRIEIYNDILVEIREFEIHTQLSQKKLDFVNINSSSNDSIKINKTSSIFDYLNNEDFVWHNDILHTQQLISNLQNKEIDEYLPILSVKEFSNHIIEKKIIEKINSNLFSNTKIIKSNLEANRNYNKSFELLSKDIKEWSKKGYINIILCSSESQINRIDSVLKNKVSDKLYCFYSAVVKEGFIDHNNKVVIYTDHQIFNRYLKFRKNRFSTYRRISLEDFNNLNVGDYVVHIDHGIGIFDGLKSIVNNKIKKEVLKIKYKNDDIIYLNINSLHKLSKYSSSEGAIPKLNQIGSKSWLTKKEKTRKRIKSIAFNLIELYAKRKKSKGFSFSKDDYLQDELEASFIYEETKDQKLSLQQIKRDMESSVPMDRLICGDVGFGKTELAIRASYKAVLDNKQVAVLVPTTILALQHYNTFQNRLKNLGCNIEFVSRLKTNKQREEIFKKINDGSIDIVIGTHSISNDKINFKDLGLLIIDEEQKFGVNVKDKMKLKKENVDILSMTATPIPRTLQFSLMGARDLSILNTPPKNRRPIITNKISFDKELIEDAINFEIERDGQVFFVHNNVSSIESIANFIRKICPSSKVKIVHGKKKSSEIENILTEFINNGFNVLVTTTIIENGVDVSNANTILINNAHEFGLSDLHQMRGRVGRSNTESYCYLIAPNSKILTDISNKRINSMMKYSDLGSGLKIALRDLDIRGAGILLGADQSGFVNEIGFEMYQRILNDAINELKKERLNEENLINYKECQFESDIEMYIPKKYIFNDHERLKTYRMLNSLNDEIDIKKYISEIEDRFGKKPDELSNFIVGLKVKNLGKKLFAEKIRLRNNNLSIFWSDDQNTKTDKILNFVALNIVKTQIKQKGKFLILTIRKIYDLKSSLECLNSIFEFNS